MIRFTAPLALLIASSALTPVSADDGRTFGNDFDFYFTGTCTDCSTTPVTVYAVLSINDFVPDANLTNDHQRGYNFASFTYYGSDKFAAFTLPPPGVNYTQITMGGHASDTGIHDVTVSYGGKYFKTQANGYWCTGYGTGAADNLCDPPSPPSDPGAPTIGSGGHVHEDTGTYNSADWSITEPEGLKALLAAQTPVPPPTTPVPEPETWALFIAGFGLIGGTMRQRRPARVRFTA